MKNILKLVTLLIVLVIIFSGCSGSRYYSGRSMHNHGVDNRRFEGY